MQEVIDRPGWTSGNSIGVFIDDPQTGTGTADWSFYAYDQTPAKAPQLHIEYTTSGGLTGSASTTYIGGVYERTVTDTDTTETSYYTLTGLVASRTDGVLEWIITDHLGSPNTTVNPSTGTTTRRLHDPYGTERHDDGITTDRSFTGQLSDPSSGLMFYNARYYDPVSARFISPDTIVPNSADPQTLNRFTYVNNNPQTFIDPTGHTFRHTTVDGGWAGCLSTTSGVQCGHGYARWMAMTDPMNGRDIAAGFANWFIDTVNGIVSLTKAGVDRVNPVAHFIPTPQIPNISCGHTRSCELGEFAGFSGEIIAGAIGLLSGTEARIAARGTRTAKPVGVADGGVNLGE